MILKSLGLIISLLLVSMSSQVYAAAAQVTPGYYSSGNCPGGIAPCWFPNAPVPPLGYQQLTSLSASTALTVPAGAIEAFIICTGQTVLWRDDGVAPTASVGMPLTVNVGFPYTGNLSALRLIQSTASATCNVSYYQ